MTSEPPAVIRLVDGVVDLAAGRVYRADRLARLTQTEVVLLDRLARARGQVLHRDVLSAEIGAPDTSRAVDMVIHRLRGKLEREPARPGHLITAHGEGYRLVQAERRQEPFALARTNLELPRDPVIGRSALLDAAAAALERDHRLGLSGPAGVGKTRLAQELALAAGRTWAYAGCWWVGLADVSDADDHAARRVVERVAAAAQVDVDGADPAALGAVLAGTGPVLVVLDTCDRCPEAAAAVIAALEHTGGPVRGPWVLATSRIPLPGLPTFEVPPLPVGDAVSLVVGRARALGVTAELPEARIREVVEAVDGLPLGLELAAARLTALPVARVATELARSQRILSDRARTGRHTSTTASVAWSWDTLDPRDQAALVRLAVVRGPVDAALSEALVPGDVAAVDRLLRARLLRAVEGGVAPWQAVRELAVDRATPELRAEAERAHAAWFAQLGSALARELWTPRFPEALARVRRHEADLEAVIDSADPDGAAGAALALGEADLEASRAERGLARVERALRRVEGEAGAAATRSALLELSSRLRGGLGQWDAARIAAESAVERAPDPVSRALARASLATARFRSHQPGGVAAAELALEEAGDEPISTARALGAMLGCRLQDPTCDVVTLAQRAYDAVLAGGIARFEPLAASNLVIARFRAGDFGASEALAAAVPRMGRRRSQGVAYLTLAIHAVPVDLERALDLAQRGLEAFLAAGAVDGQRAMLGLTTQLRALLGAPEVDVRADLAEHAQRWESELARPRADEDPNVASYWLVEGNTLVALGQRDGAVSAYAAARPHLVAYLGVPADACDALIAAWIDRRPLDASTTATLGGPYPGSRCWVQLQLVQRFLSPR